MKKTGTGAKNICKKTPFPMKMPFEQCARSPAKTDKQQMMFPEKPPL